MACGCVNPYRDVLTFTKEDRFFSAVTAAVVLTSLQFQATFNTAACTITVATVPQTAFLNIPTISKPIRHLI